MGNEFDLAGYLTNSVETIVKEAVKASLSNPKESVFMARYALSSRKSSKLRQESEKKGEHIPPFLIASITSRCNLHCEGCYSRAVAMSYDETPKDPVDAETWGKLFREAADLGIAFIFLAGGEPLLCREVIEKAAKVPEIMFPVITNGTLLRGDYLNLFDKNRNLLPVISIEGNEETTDQRRGKGIYQIIEKAMNALNEKGIPFGVSITVTNENLKETLSQEFVDGLYKKDCKVVIYIEYVPAEKNTKYLAPGAKQREEMGEQLLKLRNHYDDLILVSFPGDEGKFGGCLATGRGFFHINPQGGAEPCPFSPYSDVNVAEVGIAKTLHSKLFENLRKSGLQEEEHEGGCALFGKDIQVKKMMNSSSASYR